MATTRSQHERLSLDTNNLWTLWTQKSKHTTNVEEELTMEKSSNVALNGESLSEIAVVDGGQEDIVSSTAATTSTTSTTSTTTTRQKQMAKHRWKILRQAILKQNQSSTDTKNSSRGNNCSSTSVYDYQLLPPPIQVSIRSRSSNLHKDASGDNNDNDDNAHDDNGKQQKEQQQHQQEKWKRLKKNLSTISPSFLLRQATNKKPPQEQQQLVVDENNTSTTTAGAPPSSVMMMMTRTIVDELEVSILALLALEPPSGCCKKQELISFIDFDLVDDENDNDSIISSKQQDLQHQQQSVVTIPQPPRFFFLEKQQETNLEQQQQQQQLQITDNFQQQQVYVLDGNFISKELEHRCGLEKCHVVLLKSNCNERQQQQQQHSILRVEYCSKNYKEYAIHEYPLFCFGQQQYSSTPPCSSSSNSSRSSFSVYTRERVAHCLSLQELTSHRNQNESIGAGVDNTGNICIWDCEKTLVWALIMMQQQQQQQDNEKQLHRQQVYDEPTGTRAAAAAAAAAAKPRVILELGAGMAGLAALAAVGLLPRAADEEETSCKQKEKHDSQQQLREQTTPPRHRHYPTIFITDGHCNCIQNNRVNVRLMQAAGMIASSPPPSSSTEGSNTSLQPPSPRYVDIQCLQFKWTWDKVDNDDNGNDDDSKIMLLQPCQADWTLVSDCTHFQNFHGELLWTMVRYTAVGGQIFMCQPQRGTSLDRFLQLVQAVNDARALPPLLLVQEQSYPLLNEKHEHFMRHDTTFYRPNVHRPILLVLHKLREATEEDRLVIIHHVQQRDDRDGTMTMT